MCSDLRSPAPGARPCSRLALLAAVLLLPLAAVGCGKKGDPMPPPKIVPAPTKELTLAQRGLEVRLELPYPKTTAAGLALTGLAAEYYGESGFEFQLGTTPIDSTALLAIQLEDQSFLPISEQIILDTYKDCTKNLVLVNFKQVR